MKTNGPFVFRARGYHPQPKEKKVAYQPPSLIEWLTPVERPIRPRPRAARNDSSGFLHSAMGLRCTLDMRASFPPYLLAFVPRSYSCGWRNLNSNGHPITWARLNIRKGVRSANAAIRNWSANSPRGHNCYGTTSRRNARNLIQPVLTATVKPLTLKERSN